MRYRPTIAAALGLAGLAVAGACQRAPEPSEKTDTSIITARESPGALATRREAQAFFDRARAALQRQDVTTSSAELNAAAAFMVEQAREALPDAKAGLEASARRLETVAADVARGDVEGTARLDAAFAAVHRAEALHHVLRAKAAVTGQDASRAGEELTMAIDHVERAVRDAGRQLDARSKAVLADARSAASELMKGAAAMPADVYASIDRFEQMIRELDEGGVKVRK